MSLTPKSPRLPSPPPPTEIQIGPKSPGLNNQELTIEQSALDANSRRRIHPGTKAADMATGPPLIPLSELDSAFQLQEHLKALHYNCSKIPSGSSTGPITRADAILIATPPEGVDRSLWLYELCRFLINKCNELIIGFLFDTPPCSASTCPEMRASEWQFLCAVHESPKSCCAIDYCCHTLDWATNIVTSQKIFPSRLSLGAGDSVDDKGAGVKHLTNIFRRLHRIFAHAWFQHRQVYWAVENSTGLYTLFKVVCDAYDLLPAENYKLPPEAEGLESAEEDFKPTISILKPSMHKLVAAEDCKNILGRNNTRRHIRQSPSVGSAVTTVLEADEDEGVIAPKIIDLNIVNENRVAIVENVTAEEPEAAKEVDEPGEEKDDTVWEHGPLNESFEIFVEPKIVAMELAIEKEAKETHEELETEDTKEVEETQETEERKEKKERKEAGEGEEEEKGEDGEDGEEEEDGEEGEDGEEEEDREEKEDGEEEEDGEEGEETKEKKESEERDEREERRKIGETEERRERVETEKRNKKQERGQEEETESREEYREEGGQEERERDKGEETEETQVQAEAEAAAGAQVDVGESKSGDSDKNPSLEDKIDENNS